MAMDPKQQRALRDGTASEEDLPRDTSKEAVREQEEWPRAAPRSSSSKTEAAVPDIRVNLPAGTPVETGMRAMGAKRIPERASTRGRAKDGGGNGRATTDGKSGQAKARAGTNGDGAGAHEPEEEAVSDGEATRLLKARRGHSKGDENFPSPQPHAGLVDERPEDRQPRDVPKARDDRSAPKGNITKGQAARNPELEVRDDARPAPGRSRPTVRRPTAAGKRRTASAQANTARRPARGTVSRSRRGAANTRTRPKTAASRTKSTARRSKPVR